MKRFPSIDIARGLVMVFMALDHTRELFHVDVLIQSPTDLATTTPLLFLTRWITHLCAPSFVFLSGVSAYIALKGDLKTGRRFLLSRGIWLIVLEFTLVNIALFFDVHFRLFLFEVIATIGAGFIILSFLSRLPAKALGIIGLVILFGHDLFSMASMSPGGGMGFIGSLLLEPGGFQVTPHLLFFVAYPILPWLGIMLIGFAAGCLFERPAEARKKLFGWMGIATLGLFVLLRLVNVYGDPSRWGPKKNLVYTLLSFLNLSKYPPSLLFCLCMLGILFLVLWASEGKEERVHLVTRTLSVYGRTPLFYFLVHLYLLHLMMLLLILFQGYHFSDLDFGPFKEGKPAGRWGLSLAWVYGIWVGVVALLFPLCRWYGRYKGAHKEKKWLRYL